MGTLFQTFNFMENKTNTPGRGGLYFEIPFFSILLNKMLCVINPQLLVFVLFLPYYEGPLETQPGGLNPLETLMKMLDLENC